MAGVGRLLLLLLMSLANTGWGYQTCEREDIWGRTQYFSCPEAGNSRDAIYCCGSGDNKYCCSFQAHEELVEDLMENLPTIVGVIAAVVLTIIVLCIVCCCCCPFCILYKRRNRGTVHNPNPEVSVMQPLQGQPQPYPAQPAPYPAQPPMQAPQGGYPVQPQPYQPYPPAAAPAPYPTEQPPMYTEKQPPPYNPTY